MEHVWSWSMDQCRSSIRFRDLHIYIYDSSILMWLHDFICMARQEWHWTNNNYQRGNKSPRHSGRKRCHWHCTDQIVGSESRCLRRSRVPTPHDTAWVCSSLEPCLTLCEPLLQARGCQCHRVLHLLIAPERSAYRCLPGPQEVGFGGTFHHSQVTPTVAFTPIWNSIIMIHYDHWAFTILIISRYLKILKSWLCGSLMHD